MPQVDFHTGLADKLAYACRLVRKAWRAGHRVVVTGDAAQLARLDSLLWTFDVGEFLPHARLRAGEPPLARLARTPVWLADEAGDAGTCDVLVNLGPAGLADTALPARTVELVDASEADVRTGRQRWRAHIAAGRQPTNHPQATA